ncbi:MAG: hypothetical protein HKN47_03735 [Pirellulaceae bacterium]|nr:hypothetical protein [Pirellulaceae bacterium]
MDSSLHPSTSTADGQSSSTTGAWMGARELIYAIGLLIWVGLAAIDSGAQQSGELPPTAAIRGAAGGQQDSAGGLSVRAFMLLDSSDNLVMIPGMTYERWLQLDSGADPNSQVFVFEPLEIDGHVSDGRAELDIKLDVTIEPTDGQLVSIPLRMSNFFLLRAPEFTSDPPASDLETQLIDAGSDGMVLKVRAERRRNLTVRMSVAAQVKDNATAALDFQLPNLPTNVHLETDAADLIGEIIGSGPEVLRTRKSKDGRTIFDVVSGGGSFTLQWRSAQRGVESTPLLEADSVVDVNWGAPQDQPIASIQLTVRNLRELRGAIDSFVLELPQGSVLLDTPILESSGRAVTVVPVDGQPNQIVVSVPDQERFQRLDMRFELQLANDDASAGAPLGLTVPRVIGALRQQGEIEIRTGADYRLRWREGPWVRSYLAKPREGSNSGRLYQFRFDRGEFVLPIWLATDKRQLRLTSESLIKLRGSSASLEMEISFNGQATESRTLQMDLANWQLRSVIDAETDETLSWFEAGQTLSIELNERPGDLPPIKIFADHLLDDQSGEIMFDLPRVVKVDESLSVGNMTVSLQSVGRSTLVVDLAQSKGLERSPLPAAAVRPKTATSRFRLTTPDTLARVVGSMVDQPPQIIIASNAQIRLVGDQLMTMVDWTIDPQVDLVGSLPVRVRGMSMSATETGTIDSQTGSNRDPSEFETANRSVARSTESSWSVTVNDNGSDVAAQLVPLGGDRFELKSDLLGQDESIIRWRHQTTVPASVLTDEIHLVELPIPALADVTVRGDVIVTVQGDSSNDLYAADSQSRSEAIFQTLPDQVRVRLAKRTTSQDDLAIRKAVLRSAVGTATRHEQLLAQIQGGESLDLGLPVGLSDVDYEAFVDGERVMVSRDKNALRMSLPGDNETHLIDLRIWVEEPTHGLLANIRPTLQIPVRAGRVYWQIVLPRDGHVVWAAPSIGRAMNWQFDPWRLARQPIHNDSALIQWVGAKSASTMPPGNRYLYIGSDVRSFNVRTMAMPSLWLIIGGFVLGVAWLLTYVPASRTPLTAVAGAVLFAGLLSIAPDAAVLAGQLAMVALVLVIVMFGVRSLVDSPTTKQASKRAVQSRHEPSTHSLATKKKAPVEPRSGTETAKLPTPQSEVAP